VDADRPVSEHGEGRPLHALERERDSAEASRDRFAFLAEVSRCLADSLDYETTLTTVAGMSLPYLGAWCIVDVLTESGDIRRLAVLHPESTKQALARELHQRYPPRADDIIGVPRVMRTGRPELVFDVPDEALERSAHDAEHLALLRALGTKSYVIVPMVARGRTLGAITFITADMSRRFGDIDILIAEDLAHRAAMAVDNARLYRAAAEARQVAKAAFEEAEAAAEEAQQAAQQAQVARAEAEGALAVRGQFVAAMSHEVRTPLNAIMGYAQLLELELREALSNVQRTYLQRLLDSSRHVLDVVGQVLDLSKTEAGKVTVMTESFSAADAARTALTLVELQAESKHIALDTPCAADETLRYKGDELRVRQVLVNLLGNAIKFTAAGGRVTLDCVQREGGAEGGPGRTGWVVFRVRDTGPGVSAEQAQRIFEPFVQGEAGEARTRGGVGLGLAISRRLARLMGGDVTLEPQGDGAAAMGGATFVLRLPAAPGGGA
jgi:signal transduction histidine kinase